MAKAPKAKAPKGKAPVRTKESRADFESRANRLITKGRQRGFITYTELLKEFPAVENDIAYLEELYEKLDEGGVDVLEEGSLLDDDTEVLEKVRIPSHTSGRGDSSLDSVQIYLKEIGRHKLLSGAEEKDLARKILEGDEEARKALAGATCVWWFLLRKNILAAVPI